MLRISLIIALRQFRKNKIVTLINLLGLTLGVCSCLLIGSIVQYEFSFDRFHPDKDRIFALNTYLQETKDNAITATPYVLPPMADAMRSEIPGLETVAPYYLLFEAKRTAGKHTYANEAIPPVVTTPEYFNVLKYEWLAGDAKTALSNPFTVVLSNKTAQKYFGPIPPSQLIGRELVYNDSIRVHVAGIIKDWDGNTDFPFTEFISLGTAEHSSLKDELNMEHWKVIPLTSRLLVKLAKDVDRAKVQLALTALFNKSGRTDALPGVTLRSLSAIHFAGYQQGPGVSMAHLPTLYALMTVATLIFLLAVINYVNLATAQSMSREKETGIRKILGSSRARLMLQFFGETFLLTLMALVLAALLVQPVMTVFRDFLPAELKFHPFEPASLGFMLTVLILTTLLAGLYPARVLSSGLPTAGNTKKGWLRKGLITFQFTIALIFITSTLIIGSQIRFMLTRDLGFKSDGIITFSTNDRDMTHLRLLENRLRQLPGVIAVARQNIEPISPGHGYFGIRYKGRIDQDLAVYAIKADENYIPLYGIKLLAGRNLLPCDTIKEGVINESLARRIGFVRPEQALGKMIYTWNKNVPIVGVVADFHQGSFHEAIGPLLITSARSSDIAVKLDLKNHSGKDARAILARIDRQWKELYPHEPLEYTWLDAEIAALYKKEQTISWLMNIATGITIFISGMGLLGLTMFTIARRTREIGIRKVLGASVLDILTLMCRDILLLVALAFALATPIAWYGMHRWLNDFAYRIQPGFLLFMEAGGVAMAIALLTIGFQTTKAALANPVKSLRTE